MMEMLEKEELIELIKQKKRKEIEEIIDKVPSIDIAEVCDEIDVKDLIYIFRAFKSEFTAELFEELSQDKKEELIATMTNKELVALINEQYADDVADIVEDMPANLVNRVLSAADKDMRNDINKLLQYKDGTCGAIMTTEFLQFNENDQVDETIEKIREKGKDAETVYTIFVKDKGRKFVGTVDLDDLIFAKKDDKLKDIMNEDVVSVYAHTDQEEASTMFSRYDLYSLAVVNNDGCLIGIITVDDAIDVIEQEATEDVANISHVKPLDDEYLNTPVRKLAAKCIPWILVLLILGTFTTMALDKIEKATVFSVYMPVLIAFVPTLMDTGGNAGGQTIALMIRGLATKEFEPKDIFRVLRKEMLTALIISSVIFGFSFLWFTIEQYTGIVTNEALRLDSGAFPTIWNGGCWNMNFFLSTLRVSITVSLTLFVASFISKMVAVLLPLGVAALKKDPAVVAQPLLTTIVDVIALLSYLGIATLLYNIFPSL